MSIKRILKNFLWCATMTACHATPFPVLLKTDFSLQTAANNLWTKASTFSAPSLQATTQSPLFWGLVSFTVGSVMGYWGVLYGKSTLSHCSQRMSTLWNWLKRDKTQDPQETTSLVPAPPALLNLGNSCFMNGSLQALIACDPLIQTISQAADTKRCVEDGLFPALRDLHVACFASASAKSDYQPNTKKISDTFQKCTKALKDLLQGEQQDAQEFLTALLDRLETEHKNRNTNISDLYTISWQQQLTCQAQKHTWIKTDQQTESPARDVMRILPVTIPMNVPHNAPLTVQQVLDQTLTESETIECKCDTCNVDLVNVTKTNKDYKYPPVLMLMLKRFTQQADGTQRNDAPIVMNATLQLNEQEGQSSKHYDLVSIIQQEGSLSGGHYTALTKHADKWFNCNDTQITPLDHLPKDITKDGSSLPYVAFYVQTDGTTKSA